MTKIFAIAWKELYSTFRDRNLILIMFLTPVVLSTIMGLAFGGLGGDTGSTTFQHIPIAVVNLDEGFNLSEQLAATGASPITGPIPSLNDLEFQVGGQTINLGEQLQLNANLNLTDTDLSADNASFSFGNQLANILLAETVTATDSTTGTGGINFANLSCPLVRSDGDDEAAPFGFTGTLNDLFDAVALADVDAARAGVDSGAYVAAVIIPPDFSNQIIPSFGGAEVTDRASVTITGIVEVYSNAGQPISASIVRAVTEGIVNQFIRIGVALESVLNATINTLFTSLDLISLSDLDLSNVDPNLVTTAIQKLEPSILDPVACLLLPGAGTITLKQQPLDVLQTRSSFAFILIILGAAQAIFFALFTGIFGMNSIYEERTNWTLQRLIASPTPRWYILAGKLLGTVVVVTAQLLILFAAFTIIASLVEGVPTFIWGTNIPALVAVILGIALFVSGVGVFIVGLARTSEQVQFVGPVVSISLGALGGAFGFRLPPQIAGISPVWWGTEALLRVSNGELSMLGTPLLVLFGSGIILFVVGTFFFKRRLDL